MAQHPETFPPDRIEILPPDGRNPSFGNAPHSWERGTVKIIRLGPLGAVAVTLATGLILGFGFLFLSGLLLILIAAFVVFGGGAYLRSRLNSFLGLRG